MGDRKWNNQGGSNFDGFEGKYKKPKEQPNVPQFDKLKESDSTSFIYKIPPKPKPQLGNFGNEIWSYTPVDESPAPYKPFVDLAPKDPHIPKIKEKTPIPSIPSTDPVTSSTDLFPFDVTNEYEIVVKFGLLVLRISSGQAYVARQMINDPKYDFALVIKSSNPISLGGNAASTINLISVSNSAQNPIYSLYNWLKTKLAIATNNDATGSDSVLSGIELTENVAQLPSTQFVSNGFICGLFYADGIQPDQICLNAINKVFKFEPTTQSNPTWTVTYPGEILPLCLDIIKLPKVSIQLIPSTLSSISRGSGDKFTLRFSRDTTVADLVNSLNIAFKFNSTELVLFQAILDPDLYDVVGITNITLSTLSVTIPPLETYYDITIKPLANSTITDDVPLQAEIIAGNTPNSASTYVIVVNIANMIVKSQIIKPIVTLSVDQVTTFPQNTPAGIFNVVLTVDQVLTTALSVNIQFDGTAIYSDFTVNANPVSSNQLTAIIPAGQTTYQIAIKPNLLPEYCQDRTIIPRILGTTIYNVDVQQLTLTVTPIAFDYRVRRSVAISGGVASESARLGSKIGDDTKKIRCIFESIDFNGDPQVVKCNPLVVNYSLFGNARGGVNYVLPSGSTAFPFATVGSISIPVGQSSVSLVLDPVINGASTEFRVGLDNGNYATSGQPPQVFIDALAIIKLRVDPDVVNSSPAGNPSVVSALQNTLFVPPSPTSVIGESASVVNYVYQFEVVVAAPEPMVVNFTFSGAVLGADFKVVTQSSIVTSITSDGGSITFPVGTLSATIKIASIGFPRLVTGSIPIDMQLVRDMWELDSDNRGIGNILARQKASYVLDDGPQSSNTTASCMLPFQRFSLESSRITKRTTYIYRSPGRNNFLFTTTETFFVNRPGINTFTMSVVTPFLAGDPGNETLSDRRSRLLNANGFSYTEQVQNPFYDRSCQYREAV